MPLHETIRLVAGAALAVTLLAGIAWGGLSGSAPDAGAAPATQPAQPPVTRPSPELSPDQVVRTVMNALRKNDGDDSGIRLTFAFASPANKEVTGPIDRFIPLVKSAAYLPMINHRAAEYGRVEIAGDHAEQLVVITDAMGDKAYYVFQLSRQLEGELKGCWMTDGVFRVEPQAEPAPKPPEQPRGDGPVKT